MQLASQSGLGCATGGLLTRTLIKCLPMEGLIIVLAAVVLGALVVGGLTRSRWLKLPGSLETSGSFESVVDLSDAGTREERERDFTRVCSSQLHLHFTELAGGKLNPPRLMELEPKDSFAGYATQINERYFGRESAILTDYAFALVSATTPFEFATQFQVPPNFNEIRYVILHQPGTRTLRIFWAAFMSDTPHSPPAAGRRVWPLFVCFISEPLSVVENPCRRIVTRFSYSCSRNSYASLGPAIEAWLATNSREFQ